MWSIMTTVSVCGENKNIEHNGLRIRDVALI